MICVLFGVGLVGFRVTIRLWCVVFSCACVELSVSVFALLVFCWVWVWVC